MVEKLFITPERLGEYSDHQNSFWLVEFMCSFEFEGIKKEFSGQAKLILHEGKVVAYGTGPTICNELPYENDWLDGVSNSILDTTLNDNAELLQVLESIEDRCGKFISASF